MRRKASDSVVLHDQRDRPPGVVNSLTLRRNGSGIHQSISTIVFTHAPLRGESKQTHRDLPSSFTSCMIKSIPWAPCICICVLFAAVHCVPTRNASGRGIKSADHSYDVDHIKNNHKTDAVVTIFFFVPFPWHLFHPDFLSSGVG